MMSRDSLVSELIGCGMEHQNSTPVIGTYFNIYCYGRTATFSVGVKLART
jgi:hypothetical protein